VTTHIVTPSSVELEESDASITVSPTQAYARHIQSTSAHSQASARKAELEELRSRNLAKNRKKGISDNAHSVPFSSTEMENFFLNQKKQGQEWKKKQRETYESLHSYRNDEIQAQAKKGDKNFYHRDIPDRTKAGAYTTVSEYDRFFQQQRAANKHHRKQHADSLSYLHNYRHQHTAGEGDLGDSSSDVSSYMNIMPGDASVEVMFGDILARMRADLLEAKTCPLPESPPSEPCLEPAEADGTKEVPLYKATSENVLEAVEVTEESSVEQIEEETSPVKIEDEIATNSNNETKDDKLGEIDDLMIPDMAPSPSIESDSEGSIDKTSDIRGIDTNPAHQDQTETDAQESTQEVLLENVEADEIKATETEIDEEEIEEIHEENADDQEPSTEEDPLQSYSEETEKCVVVDNVEIKENEIVLENQDQPLEEPSTKEDIIERMKDETELIGDDSITPPQADSELPPVENIDHEETECIRNDTELVGGDDITSPQGDAELPSAENIEHEEPTSEVVENTTVKASEDEVPDLIDDEDKKENHESIDEDANKDESGVELGVTPASPDAAVDEESKEDEADLLLDDILFDDSTEIEGNKTQLTQEVESLKKDITETSDSQTNGEVTASVPADADDEALDSLLDDDEDASKDVSTENPEEFKTALAVPSPPSIKKSTQIRQKSGVETSEKEGKRRTKTPTTPKARDSTAGRKGVTFSPLATKLSSPPKKNKEDSSPSYMRQTRARSSSPWKRRPTIKPRRASLTPRAANSSDPSKRLGFNVGSTRGLVLDLKQPSCSSTWVSDVHQSRSGCSRCLMLASQEERDKYEARGHHHRINQTRGGCHRSCQFFPKSPCDAPVRLCRKCFYTTHDIKTRSKRC